MAHGRRLIYYETDDGLYYTRDGDGYAPLAPQPAKTVYLLGEGNFEYAAALQRTHPDWVIKATEFESMDDVLLAIRNGGFSGAIMPANVVVGQDAQDVAAFVHKYAGQGEK